MKAEEMTIAEYNELVMDDMEKRLRQIAKRLELDKDRTERVVKKAMERVKEK